MSGEKVGNVVGRAGTPAASPGNDHGLFRWNPLPARPPLRWPDDATVAVTVVMDLGAMEWERPPRSDRVPPPGGRGAQPYPDLPRISHREYGHRVGVFRLLAILEALDVPVTAAVDVLTAERYQRLVAHLRGRVGEFVAHGMTASRPITAEMAEDEERHYIASTLDRLEAALGTRPTGWLGAEGSESVRTPGLLAEADLRYVADWGNDEQPYPMSGIAEDFWAFPVSWELSDLSTVHLRLVDPDGYGRALTDAFEVLAADGERSGRLLAVHLHPWLSGQPFRADAVEHALGVIIQSPQAWVATPAQIVDWCRKVARADSGTEES